MKGNSVMAELKYDKKTGRLLFTKQMKKETFIPKMLLVQETNIK